MNDSRLLGPAEVRSLAEGLGLRPTKRLGQNFVHDPNTVRRIVRAADLTDNDVVVEVGPGLGSLTLALLPAVAAVHAIEVDPALARQLSSTVDDRAPALADRLSVTAADALRVRAADLGSPAPTAIVANLPYNVGVPVLLHLLTELPAVRHGLVMMQSEVVERLAAEPGSRAYGVPSAKLAWFARARRAGSVPRAVFWPVPNVDSGLLAFTRREPPAGAHREEVFAVVDAAFAQRRKALRSALSGWAGSPAAAEQALRAAGIDPLARAERLGIAEFSRLAAARPARAPEGPPGGVGQRPRRAHPRRT
ncbi:16S rRNA (adenine(1518)-N(6)/adenine(1519)-N(6))-dimethyltransferase RsmA [Pseudonocardia asaccharolytica]|uniref:Ribosomal RNA small subunit methyltransferase A n=1 Tax=Pseudonocardia asaccharolytica DSM 44247 = NBRC 16224 TaxID=1123024 RepID=A0A511D743_9PSEU|nr:16S rRNA (adenine(1518)-N(6)/adenine(1519)-N(6))-dimethyltransferase RsmA [Pseudonocardia asaccharolytica]GEL18778.1 ribosomal RNA small subunit methyltransferase A [Pseudonocardia asaccharolytica DSM 44247 = NBRC 16224]